MYNSGATFPLMVSKEKEKNVAALMKMKCFIQQLVTWFQSLRETRGWGRDQTENVEGEGNGQNNIWKKVELEKQISAQDRQVCK